MKKLIYTLALVAIVAAMFAGGFGVQSALATDSCPNESTPGWHKVNSNDLSGYPVDGATEYCFKYGSENSQGCTGGTSSSWPPPGVDNPCGLSHWSYYIPLETNTSTPTNTATNTPTNTPTDTPTNTPTDTPTNTATNTPDDTATNTATNTPIEETFTPTPTNTPGCDPEDPQCVTETATNTATPTTDPCIQNPQGCVSVTPTIDTPVVTPTSTPGDGVSLCTYIQTLQRKGIDPWTNEHVLQILERNPDAAKQVRRNCAPPSAGMPLGTYALGLILLSGAAFIGYRALRLYRPS